VFVVVALVLGVPVPVMDVVHMVTVLDRLMRAVRSAVLMLGRSVLRRIIVFVVVALVLGVPVPVVDVVHMVTVLDRDMLAVRAAVLVLDERVFSLDFLGHGVLLRIRRERTGASVPGCV
jgi:hypothetical protein